MSAWGPGLYSSDVAADVRILFRDQVRLPIDADRLITNVTEAFAEAASPSDESYTDLYLALADQCYVYGIESKAVLDVAREIILSGLDITRKRELGMSDSALRRRSLVLGRLLAKLSRANPKPSRRKVLAEPEPWIFGEGDFVIYPVRETEPINPYLPRKLMTGWSHDGWGGFVVLGQTRFLEYFAVHLIAILTPLGPVKPDGASTVSGATTPMVPALVTIAPADARRMRLETAGHVEPNLGRIEAHFVTDRRPFNSRPQTLANALILDLPTRFPRPVFKPDAIEILEWEQCLNLREFLCA